MWFFWVLLSVWVCGVYLLKESCNDFEEYDHCRVNGNRQNSKVFIYFYLLGFNASATARVISRRRNNDDEISFLVEETGVPGGDFFPSTPP